MSKITPPPALTKKRIGEIYESLRITFSVPDDSDRYPCTWTNTHELERLNRAVEAARDKQWLDMLAQQVPGVASVEACYRTHSDQYRISATSDQPMPVGAALHLHAAPVAQQAVPHGYKLVPAEWNLDEAARILAECMDYPWAHMPEKGRQTMREHAKHVVRAALAAVPEAPAPQPPRSALVAIKALLSRDPCVHANTAIAMIDEVLAAPAPAPQPLTFVSCRCFDDASKRLCKDKDRCSQVVAHGITKGEA